MAFIYIFFSFLKKFEKVEITGFLGLILRFSNLDVLHKGLLLPTSLMDDPLKFKSNNNLTFFMAHLNTSDRVSVADHGNPTTNRGIRRLNIQIPNFNCCVNTSTD